MTIGTVVIVAAIILGIAVIPVVYRMIVGPTILDRAVGLDSLLVFVVMALGLYTAVTKTNFALIPALALTGTGFIGTLALARFVSRESALPPDPTKARKEGEDT